MTIRKFEGILCVYYSNDGTCMYIYIYIFTYDSSMIIPIIHLSAHSGAYAWSAETKSSKTFCFVVKQATDPHFWLIQVIGKHIYHLFNGLSFYKCDTIW